MTYIKLFTDYAQAMEPLDDAARGRLFTALLDYARTGEAPELGGAERYVFPFLKLYIDRERETYEQFVDKQRANGAKGGRPRKEGGEAKQPEEQETPQEPEERGELGELEERGKQETARPEENPKNPGVFLKTQKSQEEEKEKEKEKEHEKEDEDEDEDGGAGAERPVVAVVLEAYRERIGPALSEGSRRELEQFAREMGAECCLRAFDTALDAKKTAWPYVRAVLAAKRDQGVRSLADWDRVEERRRRGRTGTPGRQGSGGARRDYEPSEERVEKNSEWLAQFLAKQDAEKGE